MASNKLSLGLVIGGAVSSTVRSAFTEVQGHIKKLEDKGNRAKVLKSTIGETIRLRDEWKKAHDSGSASAAGLLRKLDSNLDSLRKQWVAVGRLSQEYQRLGRTAKAADLQIKGHQQIEQGKSGLKSNVGQAVVGVGALGVAGKISADYQAIIRDIAIKADVANKPQEAQMTRTVIQTAQDTGMARNDVADLVNQLVGAGMELDKALSYAPVAAKFAVGQGASGVDTARMIQALQQNAKITDPKVMQQALEAIALQGQAGSFEAADMAKWFPQLLAGMEKNGSTGLDAVSSLGAMLQVQMKTAGGSDEAANNLKNWMEKIGSGDVVKAYKDAGIDYQASLNTGIQNGMSTLESSFALAMKYIQATDPAKAAKMAEAQAKISKETDPEKAKAMLDALEQSLRTGDIFADMQVKAALTAYAANRGLYEQLKQDSKNASGILDKNLAERRESSAQMWAETGQAVNDAMRSIGDAIRPATDLVAKGIKTVAQGFTSLSDGSQSVVLGITAVGAALMALLTAANAFKVARGVVNIGRGALLGRGGTGAGGVADPVASRGGKTGIKPVDTTLKALGGLLGASNDPDGGRSSDPQRVFVVNADALGGPGASVGSQSGGRRSSRRRRQGRAGGNRQRPSSSRPKPAMPRPVVAPVPAPGMIGKMLGTMGKVSKFARGVPGGSVLDATIMGVDTLVNAKTQDEKAEGYGGAAGGLAGSLAGAAAGAAIGSVVPVIGTAIGGAVGAIIGGMGGQSMGGLLGKSWFGEGEKSVQIADAGERVPTSLQASPVAVTPVVTAVSTPKAVRPAPLTAAELDAMSPEEVERRHAQLPAIARRDLFEGVGGFEGTGGGLGKGFSPTLSLDTVHKPAERAQAPTQLSQTDLGMAMRALEGASQQSGVAAPMVARVIERSTPEVLRGVQGESSDKSSGMGDVVRSLVAAVPPPAVALPVAAKVADQAKPAMPSVEQVFNFTPSMPINVHGDVKDPARLVSELMPYLRRELEEFGRQAAARQLSDAPHV
ncbi:phage tail tape measure protein [Pseudomonas alkylphenolica]|uniref:Phage tail tape measure protein n=1 Tax=Pseudomonas alkylphenolica TaxID=237609 RepID=A0A443ZGX3_9PSED|nr:phage tail tape measure protein [Pseudomonas alkylphenolica]RWU18116.1 phage tail tape measure protein [Pseudomonas alkylphenolica]